MTLEQAIAIKAEHDRLCSLPEGYTPTAAEIDQLFEAMDVIREEAWRNRPIGPIGSRRTLS